MNMIRNEGSAFLNATFQASLPTNAKTTLANRDA